MRIGHFMPGLWQPGGVASYIRRVSSAQRAAGHEVFFFDITALQMPPNERDTPPHYVDDTPQLFAQARELKLDILHLHGTIGTSSPTVPILRTLHGHQPYCPSGSRFLARQQQPCNRAYSPVGCLWGRLVDGCGSRRPGSIKAGFTLTHQEQQVLATTSVVTVSRFMKEQMVRSGYPAGRVHVLYLPAPEVKAYMPPPQEGTPRFLYLGRLSANKGVSWALRSLAQCQVPAHLDIAGTGDAETELRRQTAELGLSDRVTFHGWVEAAEVNQLLQNARALLFPSIWHEPGGTVAFEAMVNGRAVAMSRVGGMPEIIEENVNGLLVAPGDVKALARSIEQLAGDWPLAQRLGATGREIVAEKYTLAQHMETLMCHYGQCITEWRGSGG